MYKILYKLVLLTLRLRFILFRNKKTGMNNENTSITLSYKCDRCKLDITEKVKDTPILPEYKFCLPCADKLIECATDLIKVFDLRCHTEYNRPYCCGCQLESMGIENYEKMNKNEFPGGYLCDEMIHCICFACRGYIEDCAFIHDECFEKFRERKCLLSLLDFPFF